MKRSLLALVPVLALSTAFIACGDKDDAGPVTVKQYAQYSDEILKFGVRYPADWSKSIAAGQVSMFLSSSSMYEGFTEFKSTSGQTGAKIEVQAMQGGEDVMQNSINELKGYITDPSALKGPEATTINDMPATKISVSFLMDDTKYTSERIYVVKDGAVTYLETAVIGNYESYKAVFDTARASFKPASIAARAATPDSTGAKADSDLVAPPSATLKGYSNSHFSMQYPDNFSPGSARAGGALSSTQFAGSRPDSYIQVDVLKVEDMELAEVVAQNKSVYGGRAASPATIGGLKGYVFNYTGGKNVGSRAYFAKAGSKMYRITVNWFQPQKDLYLPTFEKAIATFQAK